MPARVSAAESGQFAIGDDIVVNRLGFGAMRVTGKRIWGDPEDPKAARETLRSLTELGVNFIDTADSYGPFVSEDLIHEILHPYRGMLIATKGGLTRPGRIAPWEPLGRPAYLRQCVFMSLRRLGLEQIDLWQLHRIDPTLPRDDQFGAIADMRKEGLIRHVGLSEAGIEEIEAARKYFPVATVQNEYNLVDRKSEAVLKYCETHGIGFIPWRPLGVGELARPDSALSAIAKRLGCTLSQVALAWMLQRSKAILPIPGTSNPAHLLQNVAAAGVHLSESDFRELESLGRDEA